ncbi:MAG: DUF3782 domain-containing protein, partial [Sulfolobaceae archaeon]
MSLADEIKKVLTENPSILADVLASHPEIIYQVLAKLTPWQNLATKQDVEEIKKVMATKQDIEEIKKTMATKQELEEVKKEIEGIKKVMATKQDIKTLEVMISALGTRWGIQAEDVFRKGMMELLSNTNWKVDREIIFDKEGIVYGYP